MKKKYLFNLHHSLSQKQPHTEYNFYYLWILNIEVNNWPCWMRMRKKVLFISFLFSFACVCSLSRRIKKIDNWKSEKNVFEDFFDGKSFEEKLEKWIFIKKKLFSLFWGLKSIATFNDKGVTILNRQINHGSNPQILSEILRHFKSTFWSFCFIKKDQNKLNHRIQWKKIQNWRWN